MPGKRRLPIPQPRLIQGRRRFGRDWTLAAKPCARQSLQRKQHRGRLIAGLACLLREDRERTRLLQQGPVALFVGRLSRYLRQVALFQRVVPLGLGGFGRLQRRFALLVGDEREHNGQGG